MAGRRLAHLLLDTDWSANVGYGTGDHRAPCARLGHPTHRGPFSLRMLVLPHQALNTRAAAGRPFSHRNQRCQAAKETTGGFEARGGRQQAEWPPLTRTARWASLRPVFVDTNGSGPGVRHVRTFETPVRQSRASTRVGSWLSLALQTERSMGLEAEGRSVAGRR